MKTKSLLIAAAALAAGVISSQAQVYSQNIVGYVNVPLVGGYNLIANPLDDGNGNNLTNVVNPSILPAKSSVTTWNTGIQAYNPAINGGVGSWNGNATLSPGIGFFLKNGTVASPTVTNTFVGSVLALSGASVTNVIGANYTLAASQLPYGATDLFSDTNVNLVASGLAGKSSLTTWNAGIQAYNPAVNFGTPTPTPLAIGQAFFIKNVSTSVNWVQTLQSH